MSFPINRLEMIRLYDEDFNPDPEDAKYAWSYDQRIKMAESIAHANEAIKQAQTKPELPAIEKRFLEAYVDTLKTDPGFTEDGLSDDLRFHYQAALAGTREVFPELEFPWIPENLEKYIPMDGFSAARNDTELVGNPFKLRMMTDAPANEIYLQVHYDVKIREYLAVLSTAKYNAKSPGEQTFINELQGAFRPLAEQTSQEKGNEWDRFGGDILRTINAAIDHALINDNLQADIADWVAKYTPHPSAYTDDKSYLLELGTKKVEERVAHPSPEVAEHLGIGREDSFER